MSDAASPAVRELAECVQVTIDDPTLFRALGYCGRVASVDMVFDGHCILDGECAPEPTEKRNEFRLHRPPAHQVKAVVTLLPKRLA